MKDPKFNQKEKTIETIVAEEVSIEKINPDLSFRKYSEEEKLIVIQSSGNELLLKEEIEEKKNILKKTSIKENKEKDQFSIEMTVLFILFFLNYISLKEISKKTSFKRNQERVLKKVITSDGKINQESLIIKAIYEYNNEKKAPLEILIPNPEEYLPLGYDEKHCRLTDSTKKHYRFYLDKELEKSPFLKETPFDEFPIMRGQRLNKNTLLKSQNQDNGLKEIGKFKSWINIESETEKAFRNSNKIIKKESSLFKEFIEKSMCYVRVYVLSAYSLAQLDSDSLSDPYLRLVLGDQVQDNEDQYQTDKTDCDFFSFFQFKATFPGSTTLTVQVWDKDPFTSNELIGETSIDLENRYFSKRWRKLKHIPIETRSLYHPLSTIQKGRIRLFVEILPFLKNRAEVLKEPWNIKPRPPSPFEIRVIIWEVDDIPNNDVEGVSDLYVTAEFRGEKQKTDVHFRAQNGKGTFNWRMLWDTIFERDDEDYTLKFHVWDKDYFSPDDFIGEYRLDFTEFAKEALETQNEMKFMEKKEVKFQVFRYF